MISLLWCFYSLLLNIVKVKPSFCATLAFSSSQRSFVLFRVVSWIVSRSIHEFGRNNTKDVSQCNPFSEPATRGPLRCRCHSAWPIDEWYRDGNAQARQPNGNQVP